MSDEEEIICASCEKKNCDPKKGIGCCHCHKWEHFKCKNVLEKAIPKLRSKPYFCSDGCLAAHESVPRSSAVDAELLNRMNELMSEVKGIKNTVTEIEKSQTFISGEFDKLMKEMVVLKKDHNNLTKNVGDLYGKHQTVNTKVSQLELEVDRLARAGLTNNMVILGLPSTKDEDVGDLVRKVATSVGYNLPEGAIKEAKRLFPKDKNNTRATIPIKVTFSDERIKEGLFAGKKARGQLLPSSVDPKFGSSNSRIMLRDEMTSFGMNLLKETREAEYLTDYKFIWPGRNGVVLVKKSENSPVHVIRSIADLHKLEHTSSHKRPLSSSENSSPELSQPIERPGRQKIPRK